MSSTSRTREPPSTSPRLLARLLDVLLPSPCLACDRPVATVRPPLGLCPACRSRLGAPPPERCPRCGEARRKADGPCPAVACARRAPAWDRLLVADDYAPPLDAVVRALKFRRLELLAPQLAERSHLRLAAALGDVEVVVAVPLHWRRRLERGFDQTAVIAERLGRLLGVPTVRGLRRRRATRAQSSLDRGAREANVRGAFALRRSAARLRGRRILLVDDVLTTGATLAEAAGVLRGAAPRRLDSLVLARAPERRSVTF